MKKVKLLMTLRHACSMYEQFTKGATYNVVEATNQPEPQHGKLWFILPKSSMGVEMLINEDEGCFEWVKKGQRP